MSCDRTAAVADNGPQHRANRSFSGVLTTAKSQFSSARNRVRDAIRNSRYRCLRVQLHFRDPRIGVQELFNNGALRQFAQQKLHRNTRIVNHGLALQHRRRFSFAVLSRGPRAAASCSSTALRCLGFFITANTLEHDGCSSDPQ
jgi:hypothetical protein